MIIYFKRLTDTAQIPQRVKGEGFDIFSDESCVLKTNELRLISTGIASSFNNLVGIIKDRGSMALKGVEVRAGVIDSNYRGEWKVLLRNLGPDLRITRGDRIAQVVFVEQPDFFIQEVDALSETERGKNGFGSTGV